MLAAFLGWLLKRFVLIIIVAIIGGYAAGQLTYYLGTRPFRTWQLYATPDELPTKLLTANEFGELYIRTAADSVYVCSNHEECQDFDDKEVPRSHDLCQSSRRFDPPPPPEASIDSMELHLCGADVTIQANYVILSDGTIWKWHHTWGWSEGLMAVFVFTASAVLIFIIGMLWLFWQIRAEVKRLKVKYQT